MHNKNKKLNKKTNEELPACLRSLGVPDLARTSRSTRLIDMSPKVRPDMSPANRTRNTITTI